MDIQIIKWNQHSSKWLACYLKWNILVISKLLVITDGCRFCNSKETDNNNRYILHVGSDFTLCSTAQSKLFVISRILAAKCLSSAKSQPNFLVCVIIRLIRISADFFSSHLLPSSDYRLGVYHEVWLRSPFIPSGQETDQAYFTAHGACTGCKSVSKS